MVWWRIKVQVTNRLQKIGAVRKKISCSQTIWACAFSELESPAKKKIIFPFFSYKRYVYNNIYNDICSFFLPWTWLGVYCAIKQFRGELNSFFSWDSQTRDLKPPWNIILNVNVLKKTDNHENRNSRPKTTKFSAHGYKCIYSFFFIYNPMFINIIAI